jgi:hypothetical protein
MVIGVLLALAGCSWAPDDDAPTAAPTLQGTVVSRTPLAEGPTPEPSLKAAAPCPLRAEELEEALNVEITKVDHQIYRASDETLCTYLGTPYVVLEMYLLPADGRATMHTCWADQEGTPLAAPQSANPHLGLVAVGCPAGIDMRFTVNGKDVVMQASVEPSEAHLGALAIAAEEVAAQLRR